MIGNHTHMMSKNQTGKWRQRTQRRVKALKCMILEQGITTRLLVDG